MARTLITASEQIATASITSALLASGVAIANLGYTPLNPANNLSEVTASTARTNLGLGTSAVVATGTSGATIPLLNGTNTWSAAQTLSVAPIFTSLTGYIYGNGASAATVVTSIPSTALADGSNFLKKDGSVTMTAAFQAGSFTIQGVATPVNATDAANKTYVDSAINGLEIHNAHVVSVANVSSLSGLPTTDGVTCTAGQVVLLTAQTTASQNGLWAVASGSWTRATTWASASVQKEGAYTFLDPDGTTYGNTQWRCTTTGTITVDTTATTWTQVQTGLTYTGSSGVNVSGSAITAVAASNAGISVSSGIAVVANSTQLISVGSSGVGITNGSSAQFIVANGSGNAAWVAMSGDVTISNAGAATVNNTSGSGFVKYGNFIFNETPSGSVNGSNTSYTLANTPASSGASMEVLLNGITLEPGSGNDYTISGTTITMLFAPATGDKLRAYYMK